MPTIFQLRQSLGSYGYIDWLLEKSSLVCPRYTYSRLTLISTLLPTISTIKTPIVIGQWLYRIPSHRIWHLRLRIFSISINSHTVDRETLVLFFNHIVSGIIDACTQELSLICVGLPILSVLERLCSFWELVIYLQTWSLYVLFFLSFTYWAQMKTGFTN